MTFVNVSVDTEVGYLLAKLEATDLDYGLNGSVIYELVGNESLCPETIEKEETSILDDDLVHNTTSLKIISIQ